MSKKEGLDSYSKMPATIPEELEPGESAYSPELTLTIIGVGSDPRRNEDMTALHNLVQEELEFPVSRRGGFRVIAGQA